MSYGIMAEQIYMFYLVFRMLAILGLHSGTVVNAGAS